MNYFGKRTIEPQSHSVKDRHMCGDEIIFTHVAPVEVGQDQTLLNVNGDGDQELYDRGLFMMTDHLDIRAITHILDVDDVLHTVSIGSSFNRNQRLAHLAARLRSEHQILRLDVMVETSTGHVTSTGNDRVKGFILGGSRGFNCNIPNLNVSDLPRGKGKRGSRPKVRV